jgi:hypothetical protein
MSAVGLELQPIRMVSPSEGAKRPRPVSDAIRTEPPSLIAHALISGWHDPDGFPPAWFTPALRLYGDGPMDSDGAPTCLLRLLIAPPTTLSVVLSGDRSRFSAWEPTSGARQPDALSSVNDIVT